jgi:hypothetical protein
MVTKEDVEKARAAFQAAEEAEAYAVWDDEAVVDTAWDNYRKLRKEYEANEG